MNTVGAGTLLVILFSLEIAAQVSPVPVMDAEVRDSTSIRMRSLEIEKANRGSTKLRPAEKSTEADRLERIIDDFEAIQKLQAAIIKTYTTGRVLNYYSIRESAMEMGRRAGRLGVDFFGNAKNAGLDLKVQTEMDDVVNLKDLIIALDKAVGAFVTSPVFEKNVVDSRLMEKAQVELLRIATFCKRLSDLPVVEK